jgi:hypothetical protein
VELSLCARIRRGINSGEMDGSLFYQMHLWWILGMKGRQVLVIIRDGHRCIQNSGYIQFPQNPERVLYQGSVIVRRVVRVKP